MVWSLAVKSGPAVRWVTDVCKAMREGGRWDPSSPGLDEALIRESYALVGTRLRDSFEHEMRVALEQLQAEWTPRPP